MAPINKMKTYGRPNRSLVNNPIDALFMKNKAKQRKKRKLVIKELPPRTAGETLLGQDSFHVSTEDTFDKLAKGSVYNPVDIKSRVSIINNSNSIVSKSVKTVNSFHSPIITRRRKKPALLTEISSSSDNENRRYKEENYLYSPIMTRSMKKSTHRIDVCDSSESTCEKSDSVFPRLKEPSTENIDFSLEVEKVRNQIPKSLSYIVIPEIREDEISINVPQNNVSAMKGDLSFEPLFTKTFREKQLIHSSTPLLPMKSKKIVNYTISPIKNISQCSNEKSGLRTSKFKNSSTPMKSREKANVEYVPEADWKLMTEPVVILDFCPEISAQTEANCSGFKSTEKVESEVALQQFHKIICGEKFVHNTISPKILRDNISRRSFITLRKRRVLKTSVPHSNSSRKRSNNSKRNTSTKDRSEHKSVTLDDFNSFIEKINDKNESKLSSHSLSDFELFEKQNKELLHSNDFRDISRESKVRQDSSIIFVNKRRRRLTDSYLVTSKKQKTLDLMSSREKRMRRHSYQEESFTKYPEQPLQDVIVLVPRVKFVSHNNFANNLTRNGSRTSSSETEDQTSLTNFSSTDTSANESSEVSDNDYFRLKHPVFKDVIVDITKLALQCDLCHTKNSIKSFSDLSKSLFGDYSIDSNVHRKRSVSVACQTLNNDASTINPVNPIPINQNSSTASSDSDAPSQTIDIASLSKDDVPIQKQDSPSRDSNVSSQNNDRVSNSKEKLDISAEDFEKFFENITKRSKSIKRSEFTEIHRSHSGELSYVNIAPLQDDFVDNNGNKDLIVDLIKSPWRKNGIQNSVTSKSGAENTVIDLTDSFDERNVTKSNVESDTSVSRHDKFRKHSISDIIESSVLESSQIDGGSFKKPTIGNIRKRHSKTLVLKAGKLWRRSLSMYKRSSVMLTVLNQDVCRLADGNFCACPKCNLARQCSRASNRRNSIRIVPVRPASDAPREISILENYAHNTSYVSDRILEDNLENDLRSLSLSKRKTSIVQNSAPVVTARELVLRKCGQEEPLPFEECYSKSLLHNCQKIGEGVYGEVFLFKNPGGGTSVMKVIPIEGDLIVNGERQKKFDEILSEITIALELSNLKNNKHNKTSGFSEVQKVCCVKGTYPKKLIDLWDLYEETRGSENDCPEIFGEDQLYIVLQLANGGGDLESFIFNNSLQAYTMFQQVACALAVAEEELHFEHRDLHWGNVLLSTVDKNSKVTFRLDGKNYDIMTKGVEVAIIDFTLSRIECEGVVIFNDLSLDPDLFTAEGDYQFEVYKLMQKKNGNNWQRFEPYSNVLWLHYTLDKALTALRYKNTQTKVHKEYLGKLRQLKDEILNFNSVKEFVSEYF